MGSMSAMNSIDRVLAAHGDEIRSDFNDQAPPSLQHQLKTVVLSNNTYSIEVEWQFQDGSTLQARPSTSTNSPTGTPTATSATSSTQPSLPSPSPTPSTSGSSSPPSP